MEKIFTGDFSQPTSDETQEKLVKKNEIIRNIENESKELDDKERDWDKASSIEIIDYIINKYHTDLSNMLTSLAKFYEQKDNIANLKSNIQHYISKEDEKLFPLIREYELNPSYSLLKDINNEINILEKEQQILKRTVSQIVASIDNRNLNNETNLKKVINDININLLEYIFFENDILFDCYKS